MSRRPDAPGAQAAKGNPGRRKSKVAKREAETLRLAEMLAAAPGGAGGMAEPPMLHDPLFAPALAVWRDFAPELIRTNRLPVESRGIFAQFCVYYAEWVAASLNVAEHGYSQRVKTVVGGYMERRRPEVERRERAFDNVVVLSKHFGFTPHDLYQLFKEQAAVAPTHPWMFERNAPVAKDAAAGSDDDDDGEAPVGPGLFGAAARLKSEPPAGNA